MWLQQNPNSQDGAVFQRHARQTVYINIANNASLNRNIPLHRGLGWLTLSAIALLVGCSSYPAASLPAPTPIVTVAAPTAPLPSPAPSLAPLASPTIRLPIASPSAVPDLPSASTETQADACLPLPAIPEIPRYRFAVMVDPQAHRLEVRQQLTLADRGRLVTGEVVFNVPANHEPGVFALSRARMAGASPPLSVDLQGTTLRLRLPQGARSAPEVTLCLDYTLSLPPAGGEGISAAHALGWSDLGMVAGYWYPVLAPYNTAAGWLLTPYHPVGDPIVYETASYEVTVQAPGSYTVIGAGLQETKDGVRHFRLDRARGFAFAVSSRLVVSEGNANGVPVRIYHLPEHKIGGQAALQAVREALPLFSQAYGAYPYRELAIVEASQFGGMEYSALITFSSEWFRDYEPPATGVDFGADQLVRFVVHELGHQWWYGAVGNDEAHEPWLDEALARYGEVLYYERLHPAHLAWWEAPSKGMATLPINQAVYRFSDTSTYVQAVYVSGTRFLLDVRKMIGDQAFAAFLQDYGQRQRDRLVTQAEFLALLRVRTGPRLDKLLPTYFDPVPGLP